MNLMLTDDNFITAGCEAELYRYDGASVVKLFYKKISTARLDYVYDKEIKLQSLDGVGTLRKRGVDEVSGRTCFIYDYIEGENLSALSRNSSLTLFEAFRLIKKVTQIVVQMHDMGVVHGDIHGENVMMDALGEVTLIDLYSEEKNEQDDLVDICKLFHEVKYDQEPLPQEIKALFPKRRDAILRRHENVHALYSKIIKLID